MNFDEGYQMKCETGDIVLMPNGTVGIIDHWDIVCGGHFKRVRIFPFTGFLHRLFLIITRKIWFYDDEINKLRPLPRRFRRI